jgi:hypothetical protein
VRTLRLHAAAGADGTKIADASVAIWKSVHAALAIVIGQRGSAALYLRSLHLAGADYPWLLAVAENPGAPGDFTALHLALARQTGTDAAAAHDATWQTFHDLMAELIGRSLTERLLQAALNSPSGGQAAQDTST